MLTAEQGQNIFLTTVQALCKAEYYDDKDTCKLCPIGASCDVGTTLTTSKLPPGYWRSGDDDLVMSSRDRHLIDAPIHALPTQIQHRRTFCHVHTALLRAQATKWQVIRAAARTMTIRRQPTVRIASVDIMVRYARSVRMAIY